MMSVLGKRNYDRVIPVRQPNDMQSSLFEISRNQPNENVKPMQTLLGCSQEKLIKERVLYFSSSSAKNSYAQRDFGVNSSCKLRIKGSLSHNRTLDLPGFPDYYYYNLYSWSESERIFAATFDEEYGWQIASILASGAKPMSFQAEKDIWLTSLTAVEDNKVVSGWNDGSVRTYVLDKSEPAINFNTNSRSKIESIIYAKSQNSFFGVMKKKNSVFQYDSREHASLVQSCQTVEPIALAFNNESCLAIGSNNNSVTLWDVRNMVQPYFTMTQHSAGIKAMAFDPKDPSRLISGGGTDCKRMFQINIRTTETQLLAKTDSQITGLHWLASDNRYLVSSHGYSGCSVKLWSAKKNNPWCLDATLPIQSTRTLGLAGSKISDTVAVTTASESLMFFSIKGASKSLVGSSADEDYDTKTLKPDTHTIR